MPDDADIDAQDDWDYPTEDEYPPEHRNGPFARNGIRVNNPHFWEELKNDNISEQDAFDTYRYGDTYFDEGRTQIKFSLKKKIAVVVGDNDPNFVVTVYRKRRLAETWIKAFE